MNAAPSIGLGPLLARRIHLTRTPWLAQYFLQRYPEETYHNTSLPRAIVDNVLADSNIDSATLQGVLASHVLTDEQFRTLALRRTLLPPTAFFTTQRSPTAHDAWNLFNLDTTSLAASFLLRNPRWTRLNEMTTHQVREVLKRADSSSQIHWMSQRPVLTKRDLRTLQEWFRDTHDVTNMVDLEQLVSAHPKHVEDFVKFANRKLHVAVARSRFLVNEELQRAVAGLSKEGNTEPKDHIHWLGTNYQAAHALASNWRTTPGVLADMVTKLRAARSQNEAAFVARKGVVLEEVLNRRNAGTPNCYCITEEFEQCSTTQKLSALVETTLSEEGLWHRVSNARALLQNPNLSLAQRVALQKFVHPYETPMPDVPSSAQERQRRAMVHRRREWSPSFKSVSAYVERARQDIALPDRHSHFFVSELGEETSAWDAFLALSDTWESTMLQLVVTVKNLT